MKIFYGAAIQGAEDRKERAHVHKTLIEFIKSEGHEVVSEHTSGRTKEETAEFLEKAIGPLPPAGIERTIYVRSKMIELIEGDIDAAIFEVSTPSLGTGIEIAHAYLRPRIDLREIPILAFYQKDHWSSNLSTMIRGITQEEISNFQLREYTDLENAKPIILQFLSKF